MINCTEEQFLKDVTKHEMTVIRDDGVHRHLRFREPGTVIYGFDLITWSGHLCVTGDCGTYVFSRVRDMFGFFRSKDGLSINPAYWSEKVLAKDSRCGVDQYSEAVFKSTVKDWFEQYFENCDDDARPDECWEEIERQVLSEGEFEYTAFRSAQDFTFDDQYIFQDFWERNLREYTAQYLWCLYAIVWGVSVYDASKVGEDVAA